MGALSSYIRAIPIKRSIAAPEQLTEENIMFEKVKDLLVDELSVNPDDVTPTAELINDLGINSLELADLVLLCEERFDITIEDEEVQNFVTVGDVADFLAKKTA